MRVVPDTNILVSGTFWEGASFSLMRLIERDKISGFVSREILWEYSRVLQSDEIIEKAEEKSLQLRLVLGKIAQICTIVEPKRRINFIAGNPADNIVLECAAEAKADYIVTYDKRHLLCLKQFEGIKIVTPEELLRIIGNCDENCDENCGENCGEKMD